MEDKDSVFSEESNVKTQLLTVYENYKFLMCVLYLFLSQ